MASRVNVPMLRIGDTEKACENCKFFSSSIMSYPGGWCGRYHSFQPNTGIAMVCDKWAEKKKDLKVEQGDYDVNGNICRKRKVSVE